MKEFILEILKIKTSNNIFQLFHIFHFSFFPWVQSNIMKEGFRQPKEWQRYSKNYCWLCLWSICGWNCPGVSCQAGQLCCPWLTSCKDINSWCNVSPRLQQSPAGPGRTRLEITKTGDKIKINGLCHPQPLEIPLTFFLPKPV